MSRAEHLTPAGIFRRVALGPAVVLATFLLISLSPLTFLVIWLVSPFWPGRLRPLRLFTIGLLHLVLESVLLLSMFGLWLAAGFGRRITDPYFQGIHYDLARLYLVLFVGEARRVLGLKVRTEGPTPSSLPGRPVLVCSRHAGPGDSFILIYALLHWYAREPRVVLKSSIAWDPAIDLLFNRIPNQFIHPADRTSVDLDRVVGDLARGMDDNDAFVIFPEGGNFTPSRRLKGIERLRKLGLTAMADRAERMRYVMAPRPGGFLAALDAAPDADVMLVAHTGLDHVTQLKDIWRDLPMDKVLTMRWWRVPREEIPRSREERIEWLYQWWERIDAWVSEHRAVDQDLKEQSSKAQDSKEAPGPTADATRRPRREPGAE